jgi:hypothetical protein
MDAGRTETGQMKNETIKNGATVRSGLIVLGAVSAMAVGALVAVLVLHPFAPSNLQPARDAARVTISRQAFVDARPVQLRLVLGASRTAVSAMSGRVTSLTCTAGTAIGSARSAISVDGVPLLSMATTIPLWRDLRRGASGADVTSLQDELAAEGFDVRADGNRVENQTLAAMRALFAATGVPLAAGQTIPQSRILWVPSTTVPISGCPLAVGQYLESSETVLEFPPNLIGARLVSVPTSLVPGTRVLRIGTLSVPVAADGAVTAATALAQIAQTSQYATSSAAGSASPTLSATEQLAKATDVTVVPPATLVGINGSHACILSHGHPYPVTIAGSQLGESYVQFTAGTPHSVDLEPPASATCK